jgi:undecaprenyl-diphosphatase
MNTQLSLLDRVQSTERALFVRCVDHTSARRLSRLAWSFVTHLGGVWCSVLAATLPLLIGDEVVRGAARHALATLLLSHLVVQIVKRTVTRPRPSVGESTTALVVEPDRFSFPSGHACAAMAVCFAYAQAFPSLAVPLILLAALVGASRVFLGVHYPGDVAIGQLIAVLTAVIR